MAATRGTAVAREANLSVTMTDVSPTGGSVTVTRIVGMAATRETVTAAWDSSPVTTGGVSLDDGSAMVIMIAAMAVMNVIAGCSSQRRNWTRKA